MPQKPFFDLESIDPDGLRLVATNLRAVGYTEKGVRDRLALKDVADVSLASYPYYHKRCLRRRSPIDVAISLLLLQGTVTEEELGEVFEAPARKALRQARILQGSRADRTWRARVSMYPIGDERLICTDHRFAHDGWLKARIARDPVMYLGADTYYLARATLHSKVRSTLDLCTGSGVHAVLAAANAERSVGVDISPRAVNFARLNAMLNDAWNAVFLEGDLYGPVGGERFDLILANPPFVPSPTYELAYRDGGPSGADVLRRIVAALPDHLTSGGAAHIVTHIAEREGEPYLERIRRWMGGANIHLHSIRIGEEDIVDYAISHTKKTFGENYARYTGKLHEWVTNLRSQRFSRVLAVVLTMTWNEEAPHPPWTQEDESKPPHVPVRGELSRLLAAKKRVRTMPSLEVLDGMRVGVPDDLVLMERRRPTGSGFETKDFRVQFKKALLSPELDIKPLVRDLLERVDNRSTVPEVIKRLAEDTGKSLEDLEDRCRRAFLVMFERGLVTLDEINAPVSVGAASGSGSSSAASPRASQPDGDPFLSSQENADPPHQTLRDNPQPD